MKLLILLVVVVGIVALAQLARVYELSAKLRKRREEDISHADHRLNASLFIVFMLVFYASVAYLYVAYGDYLHVSICFRTINDRLETRDTVTGLDSRGADRPSSDSNFH